jgi:hypothetical protein
VGHNKQRPSTHRGGVRIPHEYLEQVIDSDLKAPTIWAYFKNSIMVSSLSAQSIALNELIAFNYSANTMQENKTVLLSLQRKLKTAFKNDETISIVNMVTLFALVNIPHEYGSLKTTIEETKEELDFEEIFTSLIREESSVNATANHAARASVANFTPNQCVHKREETTCWSCHEHLRPVCVECKTTGSERYNHSKERCPKLNAAKKASAKRTGQSSSEVN